MPLSLKLRQAMAVPVEVEGVLPETVRSLPLSEIERWPVFHGNRQRPLAELFKVGGNPTDEAIEWHGDLSGVHWIGAKMDLGSMHIAGSAGRHVGSEMRGGTIRVEGNAGDWVGAEMKGGCIDVRGSAGHLAGAAYRGSARGMTGGTLLVHGSAGNEVGHTMRRGLIAVGGDCGDLVGFNMLAGTILVFGESGVRHAAGMKRGTVGFLGPSAPRLLPTFRRACHYQPLAIRLVLRRLQQLDFSVPHSLMELPLEMYHGDLIEGGRGEVLLRVSDATSHSDV